MNIYERLRKLQANFKRIRENYKPDTTLLKKVQELTKLNDDLATELRTTSWKLMNSRVNSERRSVTSSLDHNKVHSQVNDLRSEAEGIRGLNARLDILQKELDKSNKLQSDRMAELRAECRKKVEASEMKLRDAKRCIGNFMESMKNLQIGVAKNENVDKLRNEFEGYKNQLLALYNGIQDNTFRVKRSSESHIRPIILMRDGPIKEYKSVSVTNRRDQGDVKQKAKSLIKKTQEIALRTFKLLDELLIEKMRKLEEMQRRLNKLNKNDFTVKKETDRMKQLERIIESYKSNTKKLEAQMNLKANELRSVKIKVDHLKDQQEEIKIKALLKHKFINKLKDSKILITSKLKALNNSIFNIQRAIKSISFKNPKQDKIGVVIVGNIMKIGKRNYTKVINALKAQEEKMSLLECKIFTLQEQYTELAEKNVMEKYTANNLRGKIKELGEKCDTYNNRIKEQEKIINNQREEKLKAIRMYQTAREALYNVAVGIKKKIDFLNNNLVKCARERTDLSSLFALVGKLHMSYNNILRRNENYVVELKKQIDKKNKDLEQVKTEKAKVIEKSKLIPKLLKKSLAALIKDKINKECNNLKANLKNVLLEQEGKISSLGVVMEELFDRYEDLRTGIINLKVQVQKLESECKKLKKKNIDLTDELTRKSDVVVTKNRDDKIISFKEKVQETIKETKAKLINNIEAQYKHIDLIKRKIKDHQILSGTKEVKDKVHDESNARQEENDLLREEIKQLKDELEGEQILKQNIVEQMKTNETSKKLHIANLLKEVLNNYDKTFNNSIIKLEERFNKLGDVVMNLRSRYIELDNILTIEEKGMESLNDSLEIAINKIDNKVNIVSNSFNQLQNKVIALLHVVRKKLREKDDLAVKGESSGSNELMSIIQEKIEKKNDELNKSNKKIRELNNTMKQLEVTVTQYKTTIENYNKKYLKDIKALKDNVESALGYLLASLGNIKKKIIKLNEKFKELRNVDYNMARNEIEMLQDERNDAINEVFELKQKLSDLQELKHKEHVESVEDGEELKELTERSIEKSDKEIKECSSSQEHSEERESPLHFTLITKNIQGELSNYGNYIQEAIEEVKYNQNEIASLMTSCRSTIREKLDDKRLEFNLIIDELKAKLEDTEISNRGLEQQLTLAKGGYTDLEATNIKLKRELKDAIKANEELSTKLVQLQEREEQRNIELEEIKSGSQSLNLNYKNPHQRVTLLTDSDRGSKDIPIVIDDLEHDKSAKGEHIKKLIIQCVEVVPLGYFFGEVN